MSNPDSTDRLVGEAEAIFLRRFQRRPRWIVAAPGRVNVIGEHTDYNGGFVLPMAIERRVVMAADRPAADSPQDDSTARVFSSAGDRLASIAVDGNIRPGKVTWSAYLQGVVAGCLARGLQPGTFEAVVHSDVPLGGGLSSSAALEVAMATLVETITGKRLEPMEKVLLCQQAEHEYARMPCGMMDQFSSVMGRRGHLMLLDCRAQQAEMVPMRDAEVSVLIVNSKVKHELSGSEYPERRSDCETVARQLGAVSLRDATLEQLEAAGDRISGARFRRARHVIGEIARTVNAAAAIRRGDWATVGQLMYASHASLRDDYEVSCEELDLLVEMARSLGPEGGVIGSRMTGGGFGGCTVSLVRTARAQEVRETLCRRYREKTGIEPEAFVSRPAQGAEVIRAG